MATTTEILPGFQRLNHKTYLYDPATAALSHSHTDTEPATAHRAPASTGTPDLVLLCAWMDAAPKHVAKYTTYYRTHYPASPILLVTSATRDFFFNTAARQARELAPALAAICSYIPAAPSAPSAPSTTVSPAASNNSNSNSNSNSNTLLVHALSNGGCGHLAMLSQQYRRLTGRPLPASSIVYDSAPGQSRFWPGLAAMSRGLPAFGPARWLLQCVVAALLVAFFHLPPLLGVRTLAMEMRDVLNDPKCLRAAAPRLYVYSAADDVILAPDVEAHAQEAERKGRSVQRAVFEGSAHVGHMRQEPERYWKLVGEAWERRV